MAKTTLPVNYKDDVLTSSMDGKRRYRMINNTDGTVSFEDATTYTQIGSNFGAANLNATNGAVNAAADASKIIDNVNDIKANTQAGYITGAKVAKEIISDLGGLNFKEEAGKKYVRGADAVWVPLGSNPYIMGSERMENNIFVPSLESHNRNPTSIAPSTYCTITQPIDLTHINKIIIKIHVTNNTSSTVCKLGLGVRTAQPKSYADCEGTATKVIWTHGPTAGNLAQIIEYDVSGLAGNYYPFVYHNFPYEVGIFYWKID